MVHRSKDFEAMKAGKLAIWPKSQFLFHKNLTLWDFSIMTLVVTIDARQILQIHAIDKYQNQEGKSGICFQNLAQKFVF